MYQQCLSVVFLCKEHETAVFVGCGIARARALPPRRKNQHGCYLQHLSFFPCFGFDTFDFLFVVSTIIRCNSLVFVSCSSHFKVLFLSLFRVFSRGMMVASICMHISIVRASNSFVFHVGFFSWLFLLIHLGFFFLFQKPFMSCHLHLFSYIFFFSLNFARAFHIQDLNMLSMKRQSKVPFIGVSCSLFIVRRIMCRNTYALKFGRKTTSSDVSLHDDTYTNTIQRDSTNIHTIRAQSFKMWTNREKKTNWNS